jgi:hypothetical protein
MYAPGYTPPPGGLTDMRVGKPKIMSADKIRAEISRLQQILNSIEGTSSQQKQAPSSVNNRQQEEMKAHLLAIKDDPNYVIPEMYKQMLIQRGFLSPDGSVQSNMQPMPQTTMPPAWS